MEEITKAIGERIKSTREEKGLTQKQLGEVLGYSPMGISHFENGIREIKLSDLYKLASFFGKDVSHFLSSGRALFRVESEQDTGVRESLEAFDLYLANLRQT